MNTIFESTFKEVRGHFDKKTYHEDFKEYIKTVQENGVSENARYFFYIAREKVLQSKEVFKEFYNYLEKKHENFLHQLYFGKRNRNQVIIELPDENIEQEKWWDK